MRVLLWILGIVVLLLVAVVALLPRLVDTGMLITLAAKKIEAQSGVKLTVDGAASLSLFPEVALSTRDVSIVLPDGGGVLEAAYLQAGVALLPLLSRSVEMDSITVEGVTLSTTLSDEQAAAARATELDTSTLGPEELDAFYAARAQVREAAGGETAVAALAAPLALEIGELTLRDVRVRSLDGDGALLREVRLQQFTGIDLNTAGRPIPLTARILLPDASPDGPVEVVVDGEAAVDLDSYRARLIDVDVRIEGATPNRIELRLNGEAALDERTADLTLDLTIGDLEGDGSLRFAGFGSPMIDADLELTALDPALLVLAGPDAASSAGDADPTGTGGDAPLPLHALRQVDSRARLAIDSVRLGDHELEDVRAELRIVDGVATLAPLTADIHDGNIDVEVVFNGRYNTATLTTRGGVTSLDIGDAMAAAAVGLSASGFADLTWDLRGSGTTANGLLHSLTGPIDLTTSDVILENLALQRMVCRGVALVNQESLVATFPNDTAFEALSASVQLANGVATLDPLTAVLPTVALTGTGSVALDTQELRASLRARLSSELGELDPACGIDERFTEVRWPVECRGNLAGDPSTWCKVDTTAIVKDLAENEAKRKVQKEAGKLLKKLFD